MAKVLIVEDHVSMRESLTTALTAAGRLFCGRRSAQCRLRP